MPDVQQKIADTGGTPQSSTPDEFARRIRADVEKFGQIVRSAGIKVE
jgi:tripartite-type tricarboxylate transporter receptor subunit TctC